MRQRLEAGRVRICRPAGSPASPRPAGVPHRAFLGGGLTRNNTRPAFEAQPGSQASATERASYTRLQGRGLRPNAGMAGGDGRLHREPSRYPNRGSREG